MYLLDTNACIRILNNACPPLLARLRCLSPADLRLSAVVQAELLYGARHSQRPIQNLRLLDQFFAPFESLAFDDACAQTYGTIREQIGRKGTPIGPYDLMIAATALTHDLTLVTHNVAEFARVAGLRFEDWEQPGLRRK